MNPLKLPKFHDPAECPTNLPTYKSFSTSHGFGLDDEEEEEEEEAEVEEAEAAKPAVADAQKALEPTPMRLDKTDDDGMNGGIAETAKQNGWSIRSHFGSSYF